MKSRHIIALMLGICMFFTPLTGASANSFGNTNIVKFNVILNGVLLNNINNEYPLILYKNITYFPLTWDISRFLGLESSWDPSTGLVINKTGKHFEYKASESTFNDFDSAYPVEIADYKITINGESIDNESEEYPLINFRGVTYFPLTWRYAVDTFGWNYSWSKENGLVISSIGGVSDTYNQATIISLINSLTYGEGYSFTSSLTNLKTGETKEGFEGERSNVIVGKEFRTRNYFKEPLTYYSTHIAGYVRSYNELNPMKKSSGAGVDFSNTPFIFIRAAGPGASHLDEAKMMLALLDLHFIGDQRNDILTFDILSQDGSSTTWGIKTSDRYIELDVQGLKIKEIMITDDAYSFSYSINN